MYNTKRYLFLTPAIILLSLLILYPFLSNLWISFTDYTITNPDTSFVGLDNYKDIIMGDDFIEILLRTLYYTVGTIILIFLWGFPTALLLNSNVKGLWLIKMSVLIPWILPEVVGGYIWKLMLTSGIGIVNIFLYDVGIVDRGFSWFSDSKLALITVIFVNSWRAFPFVALMIYAKIKTLPQDQVDAAIIDGASRTQVLTNIVVPHIKPTLFAVAVLSFIWTFNSFGTIYALTGGGPAGQTETFPLIIQRIAFKYFEFANASTYSIIMFFILSFILIITSKINTRAKG